VEKERVAHVSLASFSYLWPLSSSPLPSFFFSVPARGLRESEHTHTERARAGALLVQGLHGVESELERDVALGLLHGRRRERDDRVFGVLTSAAFLDTLTTPAGVSILRLVTLVSVKGRLRRLALDLSLESSVSSSLSDLTM
jgi:hypothetical protein